MECLRAKIEYLETNSENKNIKDFNKNYQPRTNIVKMRKVIWLQTSTVFYLG